MAAKLWSCAEAVRQFLPIRSQPSLRGAVSQLCTANQFREPEFARWCGVVRLAAAHHRKIWEYVYILQVLDEAGMLGPGRSGLGFGVGREPLT
ncbi:MAG: hypothetical protein ACREFC_07830, partial [Stellaceae bacterium]